MFYGTELLVCQCESLFQKTIWFSTYHNIKKQIVVIDLSFHHSHKIVMYFIDPGD